MMIPTALHMIISFNLMMMLPMMEKLLKEVKPIPLGFLSSSLKSSKQKNGLHLTPTKICQPLPYAHSTATFSKAVKNANVLMEVGNTTIFVLYR